MWLSKAVEKDAQTKETLRELERLIRKYKDATELTDERKFCFKVRSTEIRWFRPSVQLYLGFVFAFGVVGCLRGCFIETVEVETWLNWLLRIIVPIFVLYWFSVNWTNPFHI